jgi:hypothetical protein
MSFRPFSLIILPIRGNGRLTRKGKRQK